MAPAVVPDGANFLGQLPRDRTNRRRGAGFMTSSDSSGRAPDADELLADWPAWLMVLCDELDEGPTGGRLLRCAGVDVG